MTLRQRLLIALRGGVADRIPRNIHAWLLPKTAAGRAMHAKGLGLPSAARICRAIRGGVAVSEQREEAGCEFGRYPIPTCQGQARSEAQWTDAN